MMHVALGLCSKVEEVATGNVLLDLIGGLGQSEQEENEVLTLLCVSIRAIQKARLSVRSGKCCL
jgi:hypothetical protein